MRRPYLRRSAGALAATAFLALGITASDATAKTLVYCSEGSPEGFNPSLFSSGTTFDASSRNLYNRLVEFDRGTTTIVPALAESWEVSDDGLEYTFKLRDGVSKEPIKKLAANFVDRESIYRPKTGFGVPIQAWFRSRLGAGLRQMLDDHSAELEGYFNIASLKHNLDHGLKTVNQAFQLWVVYNMLVWWKTMLH